MTRGCMETLAEAMARLEGRGFREAFRPRPGGLLASGDGSEHAPEELVVEEVVRFEGTSDPQDEAVLFALRTCDGAVRGTFAAAYGPHADAAGAAAMERLRVVPGREVPPTGARS